MIAIVDYGMGNLRSVAKAIEHLGGTAQITSDPSEMDGADKVLLPGVGAMPVAMHELRARGLVDPLKNVIASGKRYRPFATQGSSTRMYCEKPPGSMYFFPIPSQAVSLPSRQGVHSMHGK